MIPISDPKRQFALIQEEILDAIKKVLLGGAYVLGPHVRALEEQMAKKVGSQYAIAVANGTDALVLTLHAHGIKEGDEVITTPYSFFATAEAISRVGATPVFVDVDRQTYNIDARKISANITAETRAILPVHLFGLPADMDNINRIAKEHNLVVIEDACQALGATYKERKVGSLGDAACFSFFPTKNLSTMGDGGIITTSNHELAHELTALRSHGSHEKYIHDKIGYNSRLDEVHAAILLIGLDYIDSWNDSRIRLANRYGKELNRVGKVEIQRVYEHVKHVYHLFSIESDTRDNLKAFLMKNEIQTGIYYPRCLHLQKAFQYLGYQTGSFPVAEMLSERLLAVPIYPGLSIFEQDIVIRTIKRYGRDNE